MTVDWSTQSIYRHQYVGMWQSDNGKLYILACIWDTVTGKLFIYWSKTYQEIVAANIALDLSINCKTTITHTHFLGNSVLIGEGRTAGRVLGDAFKAQKIVGGLRAPQNYDLDGAISYLAALFAVNAVIVSDPVVASAFAGWIYAEGGKPPEEGFEYCMALCLVGSEIHRESMTTRKPYKMPDYQPRVEDKKKEIPSWQLA
jgi:hypothetical protein